MCFATPTPLSVRQNYPIKRKRVVFAPENETFSIQSFVSEHDESRKSELWYRPEDLAGFRQEIRTLCYRLRYSDHNHQPLRIDGSIRGLESRLCPERKRRKSMSTRCIVYASKKKCAGHSWDADRLAALCQKINEWSTELAVEEGARDFDRAYCQEHKRTLSREMDESRCVRQRLM